MVFFHTFDTSITLFMQFLLVLLLNSSQCHWLMRLVKLGSICSWSILTHLCAWRNLIRLPAAFVSKFEADPLRGNVWILVFIVLSLWNLPSELVVILFVLDHFGNCRVNCVSHFTFHLCAVESWCIVWIWSLLYRYSISRYLLALVGMLVMWI